MSDNKEKKIKYSPMIEQYLEIKRNYEDAILFFRLGDFYEMFFEDAILCSKELEIVLTGKDAGQEERVPMCGVPHHSSLSYVEKLINKGYKVAICEQVELPGKGNKIVKREVVKIITPGTFLENINQVNKENNYIAALYDDIKEDYLYLCYSDLATGEINTTKINNKDLTKIEEEIASLNIKELVVSNKLSDKYYKNICKNKQILVSIENNTEIIDELSYLKKDLEIEYTYAVGILTNYLLNTQKTLLNHFQSVIVYDIEDYLKIDIHSKRNLEITETLRDKQKYGSLLNLLDICKTAMGSRNLKKWLDRPLINKDKIIERHLAVEKLSDNFILREEISEKFKDIYDLERIIARISCNNANARDLLQLKKSLEHVPTIKELLKEIDCDFINKLGDEIFDFKELYNLLNMSIDENPPLTIKEGGIIKSLYNEELDELKKIATHGKDYILEIEQREKDKLNIKNLKIGYNRVFGYYLEVSKLYSNLIPDDGTYERKQTISNSERYVTEELKEIENKILTAVEKSQKLEYDLFIDIRNIVSENTKRIQQLANVISQVDCLIAFSKISEKNRYIKPNIVNSQEINVRCGRHPVIESIIDTTFVENDILVDKKNILLITGPNMSGKSTYMRMIALIVIMNQIGCFVPCEYAQLPIFDRIFTRIGSSDNIVTGDSTFMVEMKETNYALSNATNKSLLLFDEIGRGTATFDGLALAQSIIEYVHEKINCITLFSTHYHELIHLDKSLKRLKNVHVTAKEEKNNIVFLHKVLDGPTDKSYGINVASLAKLPNSLIKRSKEIFNTLEKNSSTYKVEVDLFNFDDEVIEIENTINIKPNEEEVLNEIKELDCNNLTPMDALILLNKLSKKLKE